MKKRIALYLVFSCFLLPAINGCFAQEIRHKDEIINFLADRENKDGRLKAEVYIIHLAKFEEFDGKTKGIYKFAYSATHQRPYLLIFNGKTINFVEDYDPEKVLMKAIQFINEHENDINNLERAKYFEQIARVVQQNILPEGWDIIEDEIIIDDQY
jgi:hypothetical protein